MTLFTNILDVCSSMLKIFPLSDFIIAVRLYCIIMCKYILLSELAIFKYIICRRICADRRIDQGPFDIIIII